MILHRVARIKHSLRPYLFPCPFPLLFVLASTPLGNVSILSISVIRLVPFYRHSAHSSASEPSRSPSSCPRPAYILLSCDTHHHIRVACSWGTSPLSTRTPAAASGELQTTSSMQGEQDPEAETPKEVSAFKYYFLLIAGLVILIALLLWYLHRRTMRRKQYWTHDGEQLLVGDAHGYCDPRRAMYGAYGASNSFLDRRSEGLDGNGEAPPPYNSKTGAPIIDVTIPLPTLSRNPSQRSNLPQYLDNTEEATNTARQRETVRPQVPLA